MNMELITEYYGSLRRQGPGSRETTLHALMLTGLCDGKAQAKELHIADMGCGTGSSTCVLAETLTQSRIVAVDFLETFLHTLQKNADEAGFGQRVRTVHGDMADMTACGFAPHSLDMIWSEGAIYNMGFETGIRAWSPFLKKGGFLVLSEISWLTQKRPQALQEYWDSAYAGMATVSEKIRQLETLGYTLKGYFPLASSCWIDNYYAPQRQMYEAFMARYDHSDEVQAFIAEQRTEADLYEQYQDFFGYGMYVAQKVSAD